ncbi:glucose-6-phosphate isomerase [Halorhodospira abdelmalekii]|uniref:glucose-6-phosphate isomerase n=1 Tax=Halorhodospira abdelmalekii TaxID=421629 RepID=UPI001907795B|nr:glucose-6-phosphate isomerase [Halorhodospira abdelmalekii]MBK1734663.1 glucose-6-phosphate isomerase [Halorhodospira abdelmalekii]
MTAPLERCSAWQRLVAQAAAPPPTMEALFAAESERFQRHSLALDDVLVDVSRHPVAEQTWTDLFQLASERDLSGAIERLFTGAIVNESEGRAALHTALREPPELAAQGAGIEVATAVQQQLERMASLVERLRSGQLHGYDGRPLQDVVNIGIGGSECGVTMAYEALAATVEQPLRLHTVAAVDGRELSAVWQQIDPATTLFVVASKSFTTQETLTNARTAWQWLEQAAGRPVPEQFVGVSADEQAMADFGIPEAQRLQIWDWVGGRYSLPSAVGFPVAATLGMAPFCELLRGMHAMDRHFRESPWANNIPVRLGLLGLWEFSLGGACGHAVLPYHPGLRRFPAYLQQLDMESLGKSVTQSGEAVTVPSGAILWGEVGGNAQHSFFQWLHQGTGRVIVELLAPVDEAECPEAHRGLTLANALGQAEALARGQRPDPAAPAAAHRHYTGNRPVTLVLFRRLDPYTLGQLIALHEHRVFVQAHLWGINPFDQWGVELGKQLAKGLVPLVRGEAALDTSSDPATRGVLTWVRAGMGE